MEERKLNTEEIEVEYNPHEIIKCCLCGAEMEEWQSNNPWPLMYDEDYESRCCHDCNALKVLPARLLHERTMGIVEDYAAIMRAWYDEEDTGIDFSDNIQLMLDDGFFRLPEDIITTYAGNDRARWESFALGYLFAAEKAKGQVNDNAANSEPEKPEHPEAQDILEFAFGEKFEQVDAAKQEA